MKIVFKRPAVEPVFGAILYRTGIDSYRIFIGAEGCELPPLSGDKYVEEYGFFPRKEIESWAEGKYKELRSQGKRVELDESLGYLMAVMVDELAEESPVTV
jgi:hypothetical protein